MRRQLGGRALALLAIAPLLLAIDQPANGQVNSTWSGAYSQAQTGPGRGAYGQYCSSCHLENLAGSDAAPALAGTAFLEKWREKPLSELLTKIRAMPPTQPDGLAPATYADIAAFLLSANDISAGAANLVLSPSASTDTARSAATYTKTYSDVLAKGFKPITDETLLNPDPADWINWRRTLDAQGHSPLNEIKRQNVAKLQQVWSRPMPGEEVQVTPFIYKGVMYLSNSSGVQALNAATGELIWEFSRPGSGAHRNIAIYDDKIYINTPSGKIITLNARNGALVWEKQISDPKQKGFSFTSSGIIVRGKLITGITGCNTYRDDTCYVIAYDAATGEEVWRTSTVAAPGEPGGDTWDGRPTLFRAGSDTWMPGSFDPKTNLIYWGTAQPKPWARAQRGTTGDALYSNSTLGLDPETGRMKWYFQHIPGDSHDMDEVFEPILVDQGSKKSLFKMGKIGVLWEIDRTNGKFLHAYDLGYQTILNIDPKTGRSSIRPEAMPQLEKPVEYCPSVGGFKNLWSMSYSPETAAFYIPIKLSCVTATFRPVALVEGGGGNGRVTRIPKPHPQSPDNFGEFLAMDSKTGKVIWRHRSRAPFDTAVLTTKGGLAFIGDMDKNFFAFDVANGKILWQTRLPSAAEGYPVTYSVEGRQYIAVTSGPGPGFITVDTNALLPKMDRPRNAPMNIQVYALPQTRK